MLNICTANALLPALGEHQKVLNLIAINSFRRGIRNERHPHMYFSIKIRTDTLGNFNVNYVFLFPSVGISETVGLHFQSFQHSTS